MVSLNKYKPQGNRTFPGESPFLWVSRNSRNCVPESENDVTRRGHGESISSTWQREDGKAAPQHNLVGSGSRSAAENSSTGPSTDQVGPQRNCSSHHLTPTPKRNPNHPTTVHSPLLAPLHGGDNPCTGDVGSGSAPVVGAVVVTRQVLFYRRPATPVTGGPHLPRTEGPSWGRRSTPLPHGVYLPLLQCVLLFQV